MATSLPTTETRRTILSELSQQAVNWSGAVGEIAFLEALWDLNKLPSHDQRFDTAVRDIRQHRINNHDWDDDWMYGDSRFDLLRCDGEQFLRFLCHMIHPVVRRDADEAEALLRFFNACLATDGLELAPADRLPTLDGRERVTYAARTKRRNATAIDLPRFTRLSEPAALEEHLNRIEAGIESDPALAIASSKELIESLCKQILGDFGQEYTDGDEVLDLYKKAASVLRINAESVPTSAKGSQSAQRTLKALVTTVQSLAELRNELGLGHGRSRRSPALSRHARLAATAARGVTEFVLETWHVRREREQPAPMASRAGQTEPGTQGPRLQKFREGDHVEHPTFGSGTIVKSTLTATDEELVVHFDKAGLKILSGTVAPLRTGRRPTSAGHAEPATHGSRVRKFHEGQQVEHPTFGTGTIVKSTLTATDEELVVRFEKVGLKILSGTVAPLKTGF